MLFVHKLGLPITWPYPPSVTSVRTSVRHESSPIEEEQVSQSNVRQCSFAHLLPHRKKIHYEIAAFDDNTHLIPFCFWAQSWVGFEISVLGKAHFVFEIIMSTWTGQIGRIIALLLTKPVNNPSKLILGWPPCRWWRRWRRDAGDESNLSPHFFILTWIWVTAATGNLVLTSWER